METEKKMLFGVVICMALYMMFMYKNVSDFKTLLVKENDSNYDKVCNMNTKFQTKIEEQMKMRKNESDEGMESD